MSNRNTPETACPFSRGSGFCYAICLGLFALSLSFVFADSVIAQSLNKVPGPKRGKRVIDLAGAIPDYATEQLEELCEEVGNFKKSEMVILTVEDTGSLSPEEYAKRYFNKWKIGNSVQNNGLLVFAAMKQRTAVVQIGDGLKSDENYALCRSIAKDKMVARFKRNDGAGAMFGGAYAAARDILGYKDLANRLERETNEQHRVRKGRERGGGPGRGMFFVFLAGGGVLGVGSVAFLASRYKVRYGKRNCTKCQTEMVMLGEREDDDYLQAGELVEEDIGSVDYDVWGCRSCNHVLKYRYGKFFTRFKKCPKCRYKTKFKVSRTLRAATVSRGGKVHVTEQCRHCKFHKTWTYSTPKLKPPSSSSSGGSSWSGGGGGGGFSSGGGGGGGFSSGGGSASW